MRITAALEEAGLNLRAIARVCVPPTKPALYDEDLEIRTASFIRTQSKIRAYCLAHRK